MDNKRVNEGQVDEDQTRVFRPEEIQDEIDRLEALLAQQNSAHQKESATHEEHASGQETDPGVKSHVEEELIDDPAFQMEEKAYSALERKAREDSSRIQVIREEKQDEFVQAAQAQAEAASAQSQEEFADRDAMKRAREEQKGKKKASRKNKKKAKEQDAEADEEKKGNFMTDWVLPIIVAFALAFCLRTFVGGATTVKGESMNPTLENGDILLVSKIPTYKKKYKRADIVILDAPDRQDKELYVKRIIALPGETVRLANGRVFINDWVIKENYIDNLPTMANVETEWTLGPDEYFVMGDNRVPGASNDSRYFGPIKAEAIEGVANYRIFPFATARGL